VYNSCSYREGFEEGWHTLQMLEGAIRLIFGFRAKNQPFSGATAPLASPRKHMFSPRGFLIPLKSGTCHLTGGYRGVCGVFVSTCTCMWGAMDPWRPVVAWCGVCVVIAFTNITLPSHHICMPSAVL
jgi:hypothetical protein